MTRDEALDLVREFVKNEGLVRHMFTVAYLFMRHGGEFIHYHQPKKTIADVYNIIANKVEP